jgi:hypothetical protein
MIPKPSGGQRKLGVPTVIAYDEVAQATFGLADRHTSVSSVARRAPSGAASVPAASTCARAPPLGSVSLPEDATNRGPEPAERPLTVEVLVKVAAVLAALGGEGTWGVRRP